MSSKLRMGEMESDAFICHNANALRPDPAFQINTLAYPIYLGGIRIALSEDPPKA
jgi:hypothetical protein